MDEIEELRARIAVLELALADYIARFGLTEAARKAMIGLDRSGRD